MAKAAETSKSKTNIRIDPKILFLVMLVILIYLPVLADLGLDWYEDPNYSHGFLIIPVAIWFVWHQREELASTPISTNMWGFVGVLVSLAIFIVGTAGAEYFSVRFSFVLLLASLALYLLGTQIFRKIWFAFFFMLFMIPIPYVIYYSLTFPMQLFASKIASFALGFIGLPLVRLGNVLYIPGGQALEVAEACSGLRSIVSLLALGALLAYFTQETRIKALILFASTIPIAILGNVVRITFTTVGTYAISEDFVDGILHEMSGMLVFLFSMIMLFIVSSILRWKKSPVNTL
ncbi:MAG: exosortase/archaeosortase family protein [candidate division Zixibacteria bacterium]|nr:exosortase/archaeosortase family protein [candidate division Zixibacteria bacterium]MBU1469067.1 exosortase/archaeosortase family protein [candidate division Zixibacteria bacterium]MBU2624643.1 exosortase/archaeosortase family protein [candidate division Zixibacteria bacterium]